MKITFKNVGQGDSIILEWIEMGVNKIGIIDCSYNKSNHTNPVLEFIRQQKTEEIQFVFLSHPHLDHFSGLLELLEHCEQKNIIIQNFAHTMRFEPTYLHFAIKENEGKQKLLAVIKKINKLYKEKLIIKRTYAELGWYISLNNEWNLKSLAPTEDEINTYIKAVGLLKEKKISNSACSQAANLLASILQISSQENTIALLTSDAELQAFDTIQERCKEIFDNKLILCQVPHHGSIKNHKISFWKNFRKNEDCPAVISVGEPSKYDHPDEKVVRDFMENGFRVYATNNVNGMAAFILGHEQQALSIALDDESELEEYFNTEGDKIFKLQSQTAIAV